MDQQLETEVVTAEAGVEVDGNVSDGVEESRCESVAMTEDSLGEVEEDEDDKEEEGDDEKKDEELMEADLEQESNETEDKKDDEEIEDGKETPQSFRLSNNGVMCMEFLEDQGREFNFTDLDLICYDGYIQVHRCLLMSASKFFKDLLIEKDIRDTTAITLQDVSVRHLQVVLGLLYTGRTLIDSSDEVEVFKIMRMLGLPVADLMWRFAKVNEANQVTVLRHVSEDIPAACEVKEEENSDKSTDDGISKTDTENGGSLENGGNVDDQETEQPVDEEYSEEKLLLQMMAAASDSDSIKDYAPISEKGIQYQVEDSKNNNQYKLNGCTSGDAAELEFQQDNQMDKGRHGNVISHLEPTQKVDLESLNESRSNYTSHSISSDLFEDLNFDEACEDLQKQVANAKPFMNAVSNGYEMKLRKRKLSGNQESTKTASDNEQPTRKTRSGGNINEFNPKKKKVAPKRGKKRIFANGTNSDDEDDDNGVGKTTYKPTSTTGREKSVNKFSSGKAGKTDPTSQRRLSTCSSTTDSTNGTKNRVFLEVKEIHGVKYNIYGLMDPAKGIQSGKTIAIMAKKDHVVKNSSAKN